MLLVVFHLADQGFALRIDAVERVVRAVEITPLPGAAGDAVRGVINLFGRIVPVMDLRRCFGLPDKPLALGDQFIVTHGGARPLALWVDGVDGVLNLPEQQVASAEAILPARSGKGIAGMATLADRILFIETPDALYVPPADGAGG